MYLADLRLITAITRGGLSLGRLKELMKWLLGGGLGLLLELLFVR